MAALDFLRKAFPFIATAASLSGVPLAAVGVNALGAALGCDKQNPSPTDLSLALAKATPDQLIAARKVEQDFALQMQQMSFQNAEDLEKVFAGDRADARAREVSLKDKIPAILAITITVGFFGLLVSMLKWPPPPQNVQLLDVMIGSLGAAWLAITNYYFGSSAGSARKSELLAMTPPVTNGNVK